LAEGSFDKLQAEEIQEETYQVTTIQNLKQNLKGSIMFM
jgi:predicted transcriptional regulator